MNQLLFDFMAPPPKPAPPPPPPPCPVVERLIQTGLVPNEFILNLNRGLTNQDETELPSRAFRFPIEFMSRDRREDGVSRLLLRHPDLGDLPFVRRVAELTGEPIIWEEQDEFGRDRMHADWWHAVDLCTEEHWRDLLRTQNFTRRDCILQAIGHHLRGPLTIKSARLILAELESEEPADRSESALRSKMLSPGRMTSEGKAKQTYWAVNFHGEPETIAWGFVHGIEDGWFAKDRGGHLIMGKEGIARLDLK